mgnify:CR=1 FL=1
MKATKTVAVFGAFDSKGEEFQYLIDLLREMELRPVLSLRARVASVRWLEEGEGAGGLPPIPPRRAGGAQRHRRRGAGHGAADGEVRRSGAAHAALGHPNQIRLGHGRSPGGIAGAAGAAEAANPARESGMSTPSAEKRMILTYTSAWKLSGNKGRRARSTRRQVRIS